MFRPIVRQFFDTALSYKIKDYLDYKQTVHYKDTLALTHTCLSYGILDKTNTKKILVLNSIFGTVGEVLKNYKYQFLLTSPLSEEYDYLQDEYQNFFRLLDWKNNIIKLGFNPQCIIDYYLEIENEFDLKTYQEFLNINHRPIIITLLDSPLSLSILKSSFESNRYEFKEDLIKKIQFVLFNKISNYDLKKLIIFYPLPIIYKKEDE